jgi:hypothetical protein
MTENFDTPIKSKNLEAALEFLFLNLGLKFTPDAIKETVNSNYGGYRGAIDCSHASTGRMLRRAEVKCTVYKGHELMRDTRRNATDTDDIAVFYLSAYEFHPAQYC